MNIEQAKAHIGKAVVLLPETNPYSNSEYPDLWKKFDLYGLSEGKIISVNGVGDVLVEFECEDDETAITGEYASLKVCFNPKHIALVNRNCSTERPCTPCYTDEGICEEKLQAFLTEMTEVSYKHGLKFVYPMDAETLAVTELHEDDLRGGGMGYQEVIKGSGFVEF